MLKPVGKYVLIKPVLEDKIGSFILPINAKQKNSLQGEVIAVGEIKDCEVEPGNTVIFTNTFQLEDEDGNWVVPYEKILYVL